MQVNFDTARCTVRPFKEEDIDSFMSYRNDNEWMKYQGFKGLSKEAYREALLCPCDLEKGVQLAVICKRNDTLIGDIYVRRDGETYWIGYTIHPEKARQGYMHEVVSTAMERMACDGVAVVKAAVAAENEASAAFLRKLEFDLIGTENGERIFSKRLDRTTQRVTDGHPGRAMNDV